MDLLQPVVISHQLRSPQNLGALARVMANFGVSQLILSDPLTHDFRGAEQLAVGAEQVLQRLAVAPTLAEARKDAVYVVGTTSRTGLKRRSPISCAEAVRRLFQHAARGPVAIVLGGEKRGLSDEELEGCDDAAFIPTDAAQPSMNVSHALAVLLYELRRDAPPVLPRDEPGATHAELDRLKDVMKGALLSSEFLNPQAPEHVLNELVRTLTRGSGLSSREANQWRAAFEHVARTVKR